MHQTIAPALEEPAQVGDYVCAFCARAGEETRAGTGISWCVRCSRRTGRVLAKTPAPPPDEVAVAPPAAELAPELAEPPPAAGPGLPERGPLRFGPKAR